MKKMLAKAVALSLVLGGVGFVANNAYAAAIGEGVKVHSADVGVGGYDVKTENKLQNGTVLAEQKDLAKVNSDAEFAKTVATKAYSMAQTEQLERNKADIQIREDMKKADKDLSDKIDANAKDIATNKGNIQQNANDISDNKVAIMKEAAARRGDIADVNFKAGLEKQERENNDKKLDAKIDSNAAKVQEQLDAQDNKNKAQDESIKANGAAIKANKDAIKANADAIKANKAEADEQHKYLNSRIENNTANIDKNKVAIAQEKKDREHADQKLQDQITINKGQIENEATNRANEDKRIEAKFDGEVSRLDSRIDKLDANVEKVGAMAAAIANLHTMGYDPEAPTEIAVGVGQYRDKTGMALGAFHYPNRDFMLSFSVSTAGDEFMGGIGATWKFGRKSPEELRQAEAEKAAKAKLAKAEAAKKAAKDARVAAQQKRHAEMLAARTGK